MILFSVKESLLLHAVEKSRGMKDPRVQHKHCSSVTQSELKNLLNKKCMYLLILCFILSLDSEVSKTRHLMISLGATEEHQPTLVNALLTASPHRFSGDIQSIMNTA